MKKILIVDEKGRETSALIELLRQYGIEAVCKNTDFLYENAEKPDFTDIDAMVYYGNTPNFVKTCFETAKNAGIKRAVLVGSALSYFDRTYPDKKLAEKHNYIRQANICAEESLSFASEMSVSIAELPFANGEWPLDFTTIDGAIGMDGARFYLAPEGGTAEITVENAAKAIYAVLINGENGLKYPVCDKCRKFKDILREKLGESAKIYEYPVEFDWVTVILKKSELKKAAVVAEFDLKDLYADFLTHNWYFDDSSVKKALKYDETYAAGNNECPIDTIPIE